MALPAAPAIPPRSWRGSVGSAMEGSAFLIPGSIGSAVLIFSHVSPDILGSAVLALMLGLLLIHLSQAFSTRPILYSARFFESTTLAAMMDQVVIHLPVWGVADTPGTRLALLCLIGGCAGLWVGALYLMRADRLTRYIPAPVFAGFSNSIALALLFSQTEMLLDLVMEPNAIMPVVTMVAVVLATGLALRRWRPRWPAAALALSTGVLVGLGWKFLGTAMPTVGAGGTLTLVLPVALADFQALRQSGALWSIAVSVAGHSAILGAVIFINTTIAAQVMTLADGRRRDSRASTAIGTAALQFVIGMIGCAPLSGAPQASTAATRYQPLGAQALVLCGLAAALVYLSGATTWLPVAALCAALLCEAWFMVNPRSLTLMGNWIMRRPMDPNSREDLALITAVTGAAVLFNMVAALLVGLMLGLVLFAVRNARKPVRNVWTGAQLHSNCARSTGDMRVLARHGGDILVFQLEGDLFFGAADQLETEVIAGLAPATCAVIDWTRVRHIDSSVAHAAMRIHQAAQARSMPLWHAGADMHGGNVASVLERQLPGARFVDDLDHALEQAENHVLQVNTPQASDAEATAFIQAVNLFRGLDEREQSFLMDTMQHRQYQPGERIVSAGDPGDELLLVLHGTASVMVQDDEGRHVRLAGVRRGASLGEIAFLDRSPRSASVVAHDHVTVAFLSRDAFDAMWLSRPELVRKLLANIAVDLAARLRYTNRLAIARQGQR
ncbi:cyclic nucleotide-binding domain-containing protein [Caenimonas sp. SL110]|uniref:cyclic nucleotide-binding domain-containing protein n=1 Tax=Caenimonas sp. SL110 TaxID=1450524 RepID=UPI000653CD1D|nr:cyclic nucleotide-binding domain-containing protein [Caenimonas sp. SL110]